MFDLLGKELKCTQELKEAESLQKIRAQFYEVARHVWVELKLQLRTIYVRCFEVIYTRQQNAILQPE